MSTAIDFRFTTSGPARFKPATTVSLEFTTDGNEWWSVDASHEHAETRERAIELALQQCDRYIKTASQVPNCICPDTVAEFTMMKAQILEFIAA